MTPLLPERGGAQVVLIVDDVPDNLALLHDALDAAGYLVLVAVDGESALQRAAQALPDIVLLDAAMPGMDGFEVARRLKAAAETAAIPIVFMTGLTETEHVVAGFDAGGVDYVTKPIRPQEVLARMAVHLRNAHQAAHANQARNALDAFGHATMAVHIGAGSGLDDAGAQHATGHDAMAHDAAATGAGPVTAEAPPRSPARAVWQTPLARELMQTYFDAPPGQIPPAVLQWLRDETMSASQGREPRPLTVEVETRQLVLALQQRTDDDDVLIVLREVSDAAVVQALVQTCRLTLREAEVLYWVTHGKTNRDIGDILGASPATVKKHLERVYVKLGVETRTAAAATAMARVRQLKVAR